MKANSIARLATHRIPSSTGRRGSPSAFYNSIIDFSHIDDDYEPYEAALLHEEIHGELADTTQVVLTRLAAAPLYEAIRKVRAASHLGSRTWRRAWLCHRGEIVFWNRVVQRLLRATTDLQEIFACCLTVQLLRERGLEPQAKAFLRRIPGVRIPKYIKSLLARFGDNSGVVRGMARRALDAAFCFRLGNLHARGGSMRVLDALASMAPQSLLFPLYRLVHTRLGRGKGAPHDPAFIRPTEDDFTCDYCWERRPPQVVRLGTMATQMIWLTCNVGRGPARLMGGRRRDEIPLVLGSMKGPGLLIVRGDLNQQPRLDDDHYACYLALSEMACRMGAPASSLEKPRVDRSGKVVRPYLLESGAFDNGVQRYETLLTYEWLRTGLQETAGECLDEPPDELSYSNEWILHEHMNIRDARHEPFRRSRYYTQEEINGRYRAVTE